MEIRTQHGYLVLADISGYTAFVAGTELEHAHEILTDLLETIVDHFRSLLTIAKLEGDAVFAYAPESRIPRGETMLELIEATYVAFRDRVEAARRRTTCECNACRAIPSLDLKFLMHHGDYILQNISGIAELVGSDVNMVHRLLKNHIAEATGWRAYALFTEEGLEHMGVRPDGMHEQAEAYEHLGAVKTYSLDLRARYKELAEARRMVITPEEAHVVAVVEVPAPPPIAWDWLNNPQKRLLWEKIHIHPVARPSGRTNPGARNHCVHGKQVSMIETVLDWRPFDYFTVKICKRGVCVSRTCHFIPLDDGRRTRLHTNFVVQMPLPDWLARRLMQPFFKMVKLHETRNHMAQLVNEEAAKAVGD